jgi:E3 ubiquitin-protein ligase SHPRH
MQTANINNRGGMLSGEAALQANDLLKILNQNAVLLFNWRSKIIELLSSPVEAENPPAEAGLDVINPDEEYYAEALQAQGDGM